MNVNIWQFDVLGRGKIMESHDVVQTSFDQCLATGDFFQTFYDIFLATSPEITSKFAQTDFNKQKISSKRVSP